MWISVGDGVGISVGDGVGFGLGLGVGIGVGFGVGANVAVVIHGGNESVHKTLPDVMVPAQQLLSPPGLDPHPSPPQIPQSISQHAPSAISPVSQSGSPNKTIKTLTLQLSLNWTKQQQQHT